MHAVFFYTNQIIVLLVLPFANTNPYLKSRQVSCARYVMSAICMTHRVAAYEEHFRFAA